MENMGVELSKIFTLLMVLSLISSPLLLTASYSDKNYSNSGFTSHGIQANPSYALPNYALPNYALPNYALPNYALPNYALPNYALPNYAVSDGLIDYYISPWGVSHIFPTLNEEYTMSDLKDDIVFGTDIQIAVLDTGISYHPDLVESVTWTYDATGHNDMTDMSGHGTHVAGIISIFGIAEIYAIKVMDGPNMEGEWEWLEAGLYAAMEGPDGRLGSKDDAEIISMSLGSHGEIPPSYIETAIQAAKEMGIVLIASAGNSGDDKITTSDLIHYPAAYDEVIAVGAIDKSNTLADFSNTNSYVEVVAPGVDILSTFLNEQYAIWSGTSMAAPYMAALSAFLLFTYASAITHDMMVGSFDETNPDSIRYIIHQAALDLGTSGWDTGYGYGLIQYNP